MLFFPLFQAQENGRWSRGVATSFSLTWWGELTKIPRSPEIKSIDIRPKRFHYKQACIQDSTCWRFLHDVLMSGAHHLLMYDKRWAGFGEKKGEWVCGRDCAWHKARLLSLAIESQIYNKWRRRHKKVKPCSRSLYIIEIPFHILNCYERSLHSRIQNLKFTCCCATECNIFKIIKNCIIR